MFKFRLYEEMEVTRYIRVLQACSHIHWTFSLSDAAGGITNVDGGEFSGCRSSGNGGFLFAWDGAYVNITGGLVTENVAERRAGAVSYPTSIAVSQEVSMNTHDHLLDKAF